MSRTQSRDIAPPDLPGYRFIRHLGAGGNAQVYLYEQDLPHREVAVKVLNESALSEAARRRFTAEANVTAGLAHRHIVQVFDAKVTDDGRPYIVMPYYPQPNLSVRARRAHFSVAEVLRVGIQIGSAVETSHRHGVLHRDIKPQNILTDSYGELALTDFGIATTTGGDGPEGLSVPWSPPEILYGTAPGDQRSDVYSLGATLWHLLVGRSPFEQPGGDNGTLRADEQDQVRPAAAHRPGRRPRQPGAAAAPGDGEGPGRPPAVGDGAHPRPAVGRAGAAAAGHAAHPARRRAVRRPDPGRRHDRPARPGAPATRQPAPAHDRGTGLPWGGAAAAGNSLETRRRAMRTRGPGRSPVEDDATRARAPRRVDPRGSQPSRRTGDARPRADAARSAGRHAGAREPGARQRPRQFPPDAAGSRRRWHDPGPRRPSSTDPARLRYGPPENPLSGTDAWPGPDGTHRFRNRGGPEPRDRQDRPGARPRRRRRGARGRGRGGRADARARRRPAVHGADLGAARPRSPGARQNALGPGAAAPGTPVVKAHRIDSAQVQFSWTYANPAAGDTYHMAAGRGGRWPGGGRAAKPRVAHRPGRGARAICVLVTVRRADGQISDRQPACWPSS